MNNKSKVDCRKRRRSNGILLSFYICNKLLFLFVIGSIVLFDDSDVTTTVATAAAAFQNNIPTGRNTKLKRNVNNNIKKKVSLLYSSIKEDEITALSQESTTKQQQQQQQQQQKQQPFMKQRQHYFSNHHPSPRDVLSYSALELDNTKIEYKKRNDNNNHNNNQNSSIIHEDSKIHSKIKINGDNNNNSDFVKINGDNKSRTNVINGDSYLTTTNNNDKRHEEESKTDTTVIPFFAQPKAKVRPLITSIQIINNGTLQLATPFIGRNGFGSSSSSSNQSQNMQNKLLKNETTSRTTSTTETTSLSVKTELILTDDDQKRNKKRFSRIRNLWNRIRNKRNSSKNIWKHRHARSTEEGIRHERQQQKVLQKEQEKQKKTALRQLSTVLTKASTALEKTSRQYTAFIMAGLINALAEEVDDLDVIVDARDETPISNKHIDAVKIYFSRLGFKPLRMGAHDADIWHKQQQITYDTDATVMLDDYYYDSNKKQLSADEAFDQIDVDNSGYLDRDELIKALSLVAIENDEIMDESNKPILEKLASDLFELYDLNGDGVVDRKEYKNMVDDMAALRRAQVIDDKRQQLLTNKKKKDNWFSNTMNAVQNKTSSAMNFVQDKTGSTMNYVQNKTGTAMNYVQNKTGWFTNIIENTKTKYTSNNNKNTTLDNTNKMIRAGVITLSANNDEEELDNDNNIMIVDNPEIVLNNIMSSNNKNRTALGSIIFSDVKMDLRRLVFGAIPIIKHIVPGGPLILEPFTTTIRGSFNREDIMNSVLLDIGLRRLVMRALRRRVGFFRDFMEGSVFRGRTWKTFGGEGGPQVEIPELTNVEFDNILNKLVITGRAKIKTKPDSPIIEQKFKVRTSIATPKNGRFIRLEEPELALVIECPESWELGINSFCDVFGIQKPPKPKPLYSFFPIYSPLKLQEDDGFDLGEDNRINSLYIKDGALRFEMSSVLRPGRFLGSHYIAFTVPIRTVIITMDRVTDGIKSARKTKKAARALKKAERPSKRKALTSKIKGQQQQQRSLMPKANNNNKKNKPKMKNFFSRFVDGYLQAERDDAKKERLTTAIRDFFGRQEN